MYLIITYVVVVKMSICKNKSNKYIKFKKIYQSVSPGYSIWKFNIKTNKNGQKQF